VECEKLPFKTNDGLKDDNTNAGYKPDKRIPIKIKDASMTQKNKSLKIAKSSGKPATSINFERRIATNSTAKIPAMKLIRNDSNKN
jgi:hypothetical protein